MKKLFNFRLLMLLGVLIASINTTWANTIGFESYDCGIQYDHNGGGKTEWNFSGQSNNVKTLAGNTTSLYLKEWFARMYQENDGGIYGQSYHKFVYKIHRTAVAPGSSGFTTLTDANWWNWNSWDGSGKWRKPNGGNDNENINLISGLGSGKYSMTFYFMHSGDADYKSTYDTLKWTIGVPAMDEHTVTSDGSGDGSSGSPFLMAVGSTLTITVSGTQASTDANSVLYVSFDNGSTYSSTTTKSISISNTTKTSVKIKAKYYNSADDLSGTVYDFGDVYYQGTVTPSISLSAPTTAVRGNSINLTATPLNASTPTIYYEYSTSSTFASAVTSIASTTSTTQAWTVPSGTSETTYYLRAKMQVSSTWYYSSILTLTAYGKKTIKVKNTNGWETMDLFLYSNSSSKGDWPGNTDGVTSAGGQWKTVVLTSEWPYFILNDDDNGSQIKGEKYYSYASSVTDGYCYEISSGSGTNLTLDYTANCPTAPTATVSDATSVTNTSATLNGSVSNGNDAITEYGFYWSADANDDTAAEIKNNGTKAPKGNSDYNGSITHNLTGLTAGTTIHFIAYAENGQGETLSSVESFVVPHKVTISSATGCDEIDPDEGDHYMWVDDEVSATAATGYHFTSWSTTNVTLSTPSTSEGVTTSSISSFSDDNATIAPVYAGNTYTVSFDATTNGGSCATASTSVTFGSAYGTLPTATPPGDDKFIGWYTTATDAPVVGTRITAETTVSTADDHILYARYETTYEVIVQFKCGSDVLYPQTKVNASESSLSPTITAPEIFGYNFSGWTETSTSYVTYSPNAAASTATITATGSATIVANYTVVPTVYFKNNLGWENVYVTFDNTWSNSAPCNNGKPYFQMTQIGSSDIFYCEIPSTYTASDYAGWAWNIAFDNTGFSASENVGAKSGGFDEGEFVGRGDFDPKATMFIPYNGETETRNGGTYYPTGCWIQYNTNYSGYKVRVNTYVQGSGGTETANVELRSSIAGSTEFTATANLTNANFTYGFMLWKEHLKNTNDTLYTNVNDEVNTITSATTSLPWAFEPCTGTWQRCRIHTEATGDYKFIVSFATGKPMVDIEYPVVVGDWKLIYKDLATWSNDAHDADWEHPSRVIKAKANAVDTISFFVSMEEDADAEIGLYQCTAIDPSTSAQTWTKQDDVSLTGITANGYYNFLVTQNGSKVVTSVTNIGAYSGNFYIRTDASDGGWSNYKSSKNEMTYSEYADTKKDFTHYFMRYVTNGSNIKFCIANDYNECISDTLEGDSYTGQYMAADGNVRFMWEKSTNTISRAYISGSSNVSDRFLVLEGDAKMFDENGNALTTAGGGKITGLNDYEMKFTDDQNWVYEATIKAQPTAAVKLTAKFNDKIQYFYGAEGERDEETTHVIIGGNEADETKYKLRIVYDFKIDRLVSAFLPEDAINSALAIDADMMIIRDHQEGANQVTFGAKGSLSEVHTVYGAMKFNKYTVNNKLRTGTHGNAGLSPYERGLYWISFPFDVKLGDVFGFGTYYTHWAIEYYDGQERARDGYWADSDGFWKLVPKSQLNTFTLKAFEGYVLALDLDAMTESSSVWNNGVENVYLYFPSDGDVENISATELTVPISQDGYVCTIDRRTDKETPNTNKDRRIMDSYWHIIGTPSFADYTTTLYGSKGGTVIDWTTGSLPYLYVWNKSTNAYAISSSANHSFLAMHSYMVQYSGTSIYWSSVNVTPASVAARVQDMPDTEYKLSLVKDSIEEDHTYVRMTDDVNVTTAFEFNFDVTKVTNSGQGNIWTVTSDVVPVAGNSQPHPLTTTIVPVGVKIAANGEYTFSMPEGTNGGDVWLIDNANSSRTNLGLMDYTVNLSAGTYEGRFSLEFPVQNVVTEIENAANANADANADIRKVFVGGRLYILRDGKAYDATGAQVR